MSELTPTIFVVDDDPSVLTSMERLLTSVGYAVETFSSAREFLAFERLPGPACLVLDVRMPDLSGLELQKVLASAPHRMSIVFVSGHGDVAMGVGAMKEGAVDFLTKPFDLEDLLDAIERALKTDTRDLGREAELSDIQKRVALLTPRETEVFALVVTGMLNKQIAGVLNIGEKTVKVHRARVMQKMRARSVAELVRLADAGRVIVPRG